MSINKKILWFGFVVKVGLDRVAHDEYDVPTLMFSEEDSNVARVPNCQDWASQRNTYGILKQIIRHSKQWKKD
jgi:hypothetical protein